ncbi:hypothetical protein halTADL_3006 [Halohasta litchfieldiae]|jgi:cell division protein FtsB|uniref:DUF7527 domain-containing protein n=1 Tax=Halohasta litchfieldiae TaxID=1073996 RepID=A0A1H6RDI3_9EURY|nr:hypothetical protein [Halohasta litchfieldiae]ATW89709.1 hypothetical protein halTADL_3006 [Halohasta litchfieldiae]SEI53908.1 hypothetical protein SAMN05444271_102121 [Halohasta litchfieldiae]
MDREIVDAVTEWESHPFSGGYEGLHGLADREFSGAVTAGTAWAFMLNGRLIGIDEGSLSSFAETDGTAYEAPSPALPLLYAMRSRSEKQAQYYTNKKTISEADATLSSGSFTGYIELSENVLSGDYYTVYYGGKSMSVAFVGNSRQLLTDEEAFERADDEVGIYTVYASDLEVIDIPEPVGGSDDPSTADSDVSAEESEDDESTEDDAVSDTDTVDSVTPTPKTTGSETETTASDRPTASNGSTAGSESANAPSTPETNGDRGVSRPSPTAGSSTTASESSAPESSTASTEASTATTESTDPKTDEDVFSNEAEWRNAKTIPSLDPSSDPEQGGTQSTQRSASQTARRKSKSKSEGQLSRKQLQKRLKRAEQVMQKAEEQHEKLVTERDSAQAERDKARKELETVRTKLSEAEAEIDRLESQLESDTTVDVGGMSTGSQSMSTSEALEGTNLLVRYASKGDATLEDAISGEASQDEVMTNLRIEPHTTFESEGVSVDGTPFETFLEGRIELAFVRWLVEEFLFDIQQTGNQTDLARIYEAIPTINRAELRGSISLGTDEEDDPVEATFDLVVRDKRDQPVFVADFNESKQPVGGGMVNTLVRDGSEIIQREESFAGAFAVTTSYYKGEALDAAADATGGGLLSASRGKSFVYISRKQGFHLCLVEKLGDTFDLHVPEL